ncbi:MAG: ABC transporter substrate-binding protein [Candidatus Limnocylindrales bacterium]
MADHILSRGLEDPAQAPGRRRTMARVAAFAGTLLIIASACGGAASSAPTTAPTSAGSAAPAESQAPVALGETTLGSNESDENPKAAVHAIVDYCQTQAGITVTVKDNDHNTFQNQISSYLQGIPDDVVKWFAGNRVRFFAAQGLLTPIDDVWADIEQYLTPGLKAASLGTDGKAYFVPVYNYPWVVLYRKSLFQEKGYEIPKTIDEFKALGDKMIADGIVPLALGDKDGWPAMGTFDIINMRMNGYQFHIDLMEGRAKWSDPKVLAVFQAWKDLLPYFQEGAAGRTWQDAAKSALVDKKAGMYFLGTFAIEQAGDAASDVGFFPFPLFGTQYDGENSIDAPIDGFMLSANPKNIDAAKAFLRCVATPEAQVAYVTSPGIGSVAVSPLADTSGYTEVQKMSAEVLKTAGNIAQFLDRDTRADFAGPSGMQGFLINFLAKPDQDLGSLLNDIQGYYDSLPPQ